MHRSGGSRRSDAEEEADEQQVMSPHTLNRFLRVDAVLTDRFLGEGAFDVLDLKEGAFDVLNRWEGASDVFNSCWTHQTQTLARHGTGGSRRSDAEEEADEQQVTRAPYMYIYVCI